MFNPVRSRDVRQDSPRRNLEPSRSNINSQQWLLSADKIFCEICHIYAPAMLLLHYSATFAFERHLNADLNLMECRRGLRSARSYRHKHRFALLKRPDKVAVR
ncbi:hypothetical protein Zmor_021001 [Zophobas morio]|uniref:Uncharacterized protein n=1 Tax=Zophobas morio TaxID=2755281 RepID=A0AA38I4G8_9CUCU|nr:hypothetical protein Zmor_021001 [Zophobas morio]